MGFWDDYSWELVLISFFMFTLPITTILALFTAYIIITRASKQRNALKKARQERHDKYEEKREKMREIKKLECEKREAEEKNQYDSIPNLQELIQNYVYHQLKLMLNDIDKIIQFSNYDDQIRYWLYSRIDSFVDYLRLESNELSPYQVDLLKKDCYLVSEPVRKVLIDVFKDYKKHSDDFTNEEQKRQYLEMKKEISEQVFGKLQLNEREKLGKKDTQFITDQIEHLLQQYSIWENDGFFKN